VARLAELLAEQLAEIELALVVEEVGCSIRVVATASCCSLYWVVIVGLLVGSREAYRVPMGQQLEFCRCQSRHSR
jgi:hypothetical protein